MLLQPPICTRTDTRFPDTTVCRSDHRNAASCCSPGTAAPAAVPATILSRATAAIATSPPASQKPSSYCMGLLPREVGGERGGARSEEHTSELQSLMRSSYAVFCLTQHIKATTAQ